MSNESTSNESTSNESTSNESKRPSRRRHQQQHQQTPTTPPQTRALQSSPPSSPHPSLQDAGTSEAAPPRPVVTIYDMQPSPRGEPPQLTNKGHSGSIAYYESVQGGPYLFVYDAEREEATLYIGYIGWLPFPVEDGVIVDNLMGLYPDVSAWLRLCWMGATATPIAADEFPVSNLWTQDDLDSLRDRIHGTVVEADARGPTAPPSNETPASSSDAGRERESPLLDDEG